MYMYIPELYKHTGIPQTPTLGKSQVYINKNSLIAIGGTMAFRVNQGVCVLLVRGHGCVCIVS